ncbi:MAG TPA: thiamine pyrophosphate-binding protein [Beijerinckiaceae bacterium]|jgi:acetolactate synthase-1/2/3 large subunit
MTAFRGADLLARALDRAGLRTVFTLSGNHIMPLFDAALGTGLQLIHVRHEAAAVHMADAFARLTGRCGVALVTGGAGHTNAVAALCTAQAAEAPLVLLSGHAGLNELGRGAFQELRQADMAEPVTKASWTAASAENLAHDLAEAVRIATSGRPGPVHVSLPVDLLDATLEETDALWPAAEDFGPERRPLSDAAARAVLGAIEEAQRPLILAGPHLCQTSNAGVLAALEAATGVPVLGLESPRGVNDPKLGAFAEILPQADLIVLVGKAHDFTLRFADPPFVDPSCRLIVLDPEPAMIERVAREKGPRLVLSSLADAPAAAERLTALAEIPHPSAAWRDEVAAAIAHRPPAWANAESAEEAVHPVALCRALQPLFEADREAVLVCDGGEIGQWPQSLVVPGKRVINGVAGSIGAATPFAIAARLATGATVVAVMGDGAFGFHMTEFDTAMRAGLPFVAVVGNDATWNAEHQIQLRSYGPDRTHSCDLLPTRYDKVVEALGGHGEYVTRAEDLGPALERALASGKPACVNVRIARLPAPAIRRTR